MHQKMPIHTKNVSKGAYHTPKDTPPTLQLLNNPEFTIVVVVSDIKHHSTVKNRTDMYTLNVKFLY